MANRLFDTLFKNAPRDKIFIESVDGTGLTYGEFESATAKAASALAALGVGAGDRIAVQVDKSVGALVLYLATVRNGSVFLPLNTAYTTTEIKYFVGDAEPALFVCRPDTQAALHEVAESAGACLLTMAADGRAGSWPRLAEEGDQEFQTVARGGGDIAAILYTSGTTGRPKGAMLSHHNLTSNAITLASYWQFTAADVLLHALPIFHTHGLFVAVNTVMVAGASLIFLPRFNATEIITLMPRASVLMGVPTFYTRLLEEPGLNAEVARGMRLFVSGSAPLLSETHREFEARTGHAILERYGMTETCMNTSNPYDGERRAGTVGFPLPDVEVRVTDPESGRVLKNGEVGMLEVRGPNVFKGYWRLPEKTTDEFRDDGFFITGDVALIDEDGYVVIVGRGKDLIISGGYNVYPKEVENEIDALPGVKESAVIGVPHPDFGEGVVAVVVPKRDSALDEAGVIAQIGERLARYKQPKRVVFLDALPRNAMGKVQKNQLRDDFKHLCGG